MSSFLKPECGSSVVAFQTPAISRLSGALQSRSAGVREQINTTFHRIVDSGGAEYCCAGRSVYVLGLSSVPPKAARGSAMYFTAHPHGSLFAFKALQHICVVMCNLEPALGLITHTHTHVCEEAIQLAEVLTVCI